MKLLESTSIRNLRLDNRIVLLATHLGYCEEDGVVTDRLISFYRERARHRPGLIVVGGCYTEHRGSSGPTMIGISRDEHIEGLSKLTEAIHSFDVPVAAQLYHAGRYVHSILLGEQAVSASEVPCRLTRETSRALTVDEIHETTANFGKAAARARRAGFDSVEIIGSAGYIINQFLAKATNKREDEYGGSLENRARFALEVVKSERRAVGKDYPIMYRISGADFVPEGNTLEDNKILAPWLVEAGVDCLDVTGGWHETKIPQITMDVPRGHYADLAEGLAEVVDVPVVACNRINSPTVAERILARGKAQLIGMSRAFLADHEVIEKIRSGEGNQIRPCIGCNQGCLDMVFLLQPVICAINPQAGYEDTRHLGPRGNGKIAVIGAGPAGLETSRILSMRGFKVTLYEQEKRPGGLLNLAARIPGRGEFAAYVTHMWHEMKRLGVDLRLNTKADVDTIAGQSYDRVVSALGTIATAPQIEGTELSHVTTARDAVASIPKTPGHVSVIGGNSTGCFAAILLSSYADSVQLFESGNRIGTDLGRTTRWVILKSLQDRGVKIHTDTSISQITSEYVQIDTPEDLTLIEAETVVVSAEPLPNTRFAEQAEERGLSVDVVGSAAGSKGLLAIVHSAFNYANNLKLD
ncbi:MAG: FAD-dependent oxidoreductase [Candidatus Thorarchaeota archaeon]|nr:MAG: FAD-dependent oxidoreductase [Candidatus Thorarchaeota archaeon]